MQLNERSIPKFIVAAPLMIILVLTILFTYLYIENTEARSLQERTHFNDAYVALKKKESESVMDQLFRQLTYSEENLEEELRKLLKNRVDLAYGTAMFIHGKYDGIVHDAVIKRQVSDALSRMVYEGAEAAIWIKDRDGQNIYPADVIQARDSKPVPMRELLQENTHEGFSITEAEEKKVVTYIKRFDHYGWYFGSSASLEDARESVKQEMLTMIKKMPSSASGFIAVFGPEGELYLPESANRYMQDARNNDAVMLHRHFEPFGWQIIYGFDRSLLHGELRIEEAKIEYRMANEIGVILVSSIAMGIVFALVSLIFSRQINNAFLRYQNEVKRRERDLRDFTLLLEDRVDREVNARREKEKMLIQQSKMAAMGDMLSMIAHQWRQPLNQMSYLFMNIEGAYDSNELTQEYLEAKIKEGTNLLEFMSHTIDDFRNFFRPDKAQENVNIRIIVDQCLELIGKTIEDSGITLRVHHGTHKELYLYRNELIQVLLNLIGNAKDVLVQREITDGRILIATHEEGENIIIEVCDNGGGVEAELAERIFEPYFTTKDAQQGTGLGLYMSKTIVEEHLNGSLVLENGSNGACFSVSLAAVQAE